MSLRKPRSDAKLLQLPEERQAQLAEWLLDGMPYHQAMDAVRKEFGFQTSMGALAHFWKEACVPHLLTRRARAVATAEDVAAAAAATPGRFDQATIDALKQRAFELTMSPQAKPADVKSLFMLVLKSRDQDLKGDQLKLARRKMERETCELILKAARDERVREIETTAAPHEEKIRLLREHYFADVDALEKAGGVELPP